MSNKHLILSLMTSAALTSTACEPLAAQDDPEHRWGDTEGFSTSGGELELPSGVWGGMDISKDPNMCQQYTNAFGPIELDFDNGVISGGNCINEGTFEVKGFCSETAMMTIEASAPGCGVDRWACDVSPDQIVCTGVIVATSDGRLLYRRIDLARLM